MTNYFGTSQHRKYIPIHEIARSLGEEFCRAMPFWFELDSCDTVLEFARRGRRAVWQVWESYFEATEIL